MPAKNNCQRRFRQLTDRQCHFSIRKLSVGVVSLAIGMIFYLSGPSHLVLAAEEADQDVIPAQVNPQDQNLDSEGVNIVSAEKDMEDVSPKEKLSPALELGSEAISPTPNREESLAFKGDEEIKVATSENHKVVTDEKVDKQQVLSVTNGQHARAAAEEKYYYDGDIAYDKNEIDEKGRHTIAVGLSPEGKQNVRQKGYVLSFPEGVTEIRYEKSKENITFNDANIQNIIFPKSLRKIGDGERLTRYNSDNLREIGVFSKNWIKSISFQEGLEEIGFGAFEMNDLTQLEIPSTVKIIKDRAFAKNGIQELIFKGDLQAIQIGEGENRDVFGEQTWGSSNNRRVGFPGNARIYYKDPASFEFFNIRDKNGPVQLNNFKVLTQEVNGLWPVTPPSATHPQYQHQFEEDIENIRGKDKDGAPKFKLETQEAGHLAVSVLDYGDKRESHNQFWVTASSPALEGAEAEAHPFVYGRFNLMYYPGYTITLISRPGEENDERAEVNLMPAFDSWCSSSWNYCPYLPNFRPEWPGHEFLGWYDENDERWDIENNKEVTRDMVLKGKWKANSIDIKYEFMSATENKALPEDVRHLTPMTEKAVPGELFIPRKPEKEMVKTTEGVWSFLGYQLEGAFIPEDGIILSENEDNMIGLWSFSPSQTLIHEAPHLVIKAIAIRKGDSLDWHDLIVEATSPTDGDLRKQVKLIDQGGFDPNIAGTYTLTFQVEDQLGAKVTRTGTVTVHETLTPLNEAPELIVKNQTIRKGDTLDLNSLIEKAVDKEDGDLRSQVKILDRGGFDPNVAGTYHITFQLTDSQGASVTKQAQVQVKEGLATLHEVPHLVIKDMVIRKGDSLDWHDLIVEATSPTDGDLKKQVKLLEQGGFDPNIAGTYTLTFQVEDQLGAKVTRTGTVTVQEALTPLNEAPQLLVRDQTIMKGDTLDLRNLIEKAEDKEDGDLRSQVKILDRGGFDPNVAGTYHITFQLTDSQGASVTKQAQVQVKEGLASLHEAPHLVIKDIAIRKGESLDWHDLIIEATSPTDGDLRKQVKLIDQGGFDPNIAGTYTLTFQVEDHLGAKVTRTGTVTVHETLTTLNEAPELIVRNQMIRKGDTLDLRSLIEKAEDKEDGDLRSQVKILDRGGFDPNMAGIYHITFQLTDSQGASITKQAQVQVKEGLATLHEVPHLVIKNVTMRKGESLDWHDLIVEATSPTDGDLKKQVKLLEQGGFDPNIAGTYTLTFQVEDHLGAKVTRTGTVTVQETLTPLNEAPQLLVRDQTIMKGDTLDLRSLIEKAEDKEDGDLRSQVKILDRGGFDPNVAGTYQITFQLTDSQGASVTKQAQVQVKEANEPSGGKNEPNSEIKPDSNLVVPHHPSSKPTENLPAKGSATRLPQTGMRESLPSVGLGLAFLSLGLCFCIENKRSKKIKQRGS